jgi:HAD superfamily hydrolase (TIGR01549 family)
MKEWAIIFDVDGVLLELTHDEEELFFEPFEQYLDATKLSRDWNSYHIRNDEDIVREILTRHELPLRLAETIKTQYLEKLRTRKIVSRAIAGARQLITQFAPVAELGVATANFRAAAALRLAQLHMWDPVSRYAFGADGGGAKTEILRRAIAALNLPQNRIIYIGDNVNDVIAGISNNVHFIGFSCDLAKHRLLKKAGAEFCAKNHDETRTQIRGIMANIKIGGTNGRP